MALIISLLFSKEGGEGWEDGSGGAFVLPDCQETIRKKATTANEGDSQARM